MKRGLEMKLRTLLIGSFLIIVLLVASIGAIVYFLNLEIKQDVFQLSSSSVLEVQSATDIIFSLEKSQTAIQEIIGETYRGIIEPDELDDAIKAVEEAEEELSTSLGDFEKGMLLSRRATQTGIEFAELAGDKAESFEEELEIEILDNIQKEFAVYKTNIFEYQLIIDRNLADADEFLEEVLEPHFRNTMLPLVEEYKQDAHEELIEESQEITEAANKANFLILVVVIVAIILSLFLGLAISKMISRPIAYIQNIIDEVSKGNFNLNIPEKFGKIDEVNLLLESQNRILTTMKLAVAKFKNKKKEEREKIDVE